MGAEGKVAALVRTGADATDALLSEKVAEWRSAGARTVGVLAEPRRMQEGQTCGAGYLRDIGTSDEQRIYLTAPPSSGACDLDAAGVEAACERLIDQIPNSDIVVLSKFGKLEAAGGGLLPAFRAAIATGKPVLTTVSEKHLGMWQAFAPDAVVLTRAEAIDAWWKEVRDRS